MVLRRHRYRSSLGAGANRIVTLAAQRIQFVVFGRPQPAGSKTAYARGSKIWVKEANPRSKPWQSVIASAAVDAMNGTSPLEGPVLLDVTFYRARPKDHFGTGRNRLTIRAGAPLYPTTVPDTTKLVRGLEDALTSIVYHDDAQIVSQRARKLYGTPERAEVTVTPLTTDLFT